MFPSFGSLQQIAALSEHCVQQSWPSATESSLLDRNSKDVYDILQEGFSRGVCGVTGDDGSRSGSQKQLEEASIDQHRERINNPSTFMYQLKQSGIKVL